MQQVNGVQVFNTDPSLFYDGLEKEPTWFSAQGGVYQCYEKETNRAVAIKKYLVEDNYHPDMFVMPKELVENEIYTMTKCNNPNILKLLAVYLHQEFVFLIMPLCAGGSLQQFVFEHHLTYGQLVHIVQSIAAGLEEIHRHGYIHRDIKCDNVFLDSEANNVVIGDFGVVSITPAADSSQEEAGVVLFWAPELVRGKMVNKKIDIWALGIVILEIINGGRAPYEDEKLDEDEIKQRILTNGKPAYPEGLPSRLVDLLDCCLNPDPRARASASDILKHPFVLDYEPEQLFPPPSIQFSKELSINESVVTDESVSHTADDTIVDEDTMLDALESLKSMKPIDDLDLSTESTLPSLSVTSDSDTSSSSSSTNEDNNKLNSSSSSPPESSSTVLPSSRLERLPQRKCRLPIPSFILDKEKANAIPSKEKIEKVKSKRQSINESHRNQGSRLPMLKMILDHSPEDEEEENGNRENDNNDGLSTTKSRKTPDLVSVSGRRLRKAKSVRLSSPPTKSKVSLTTSTSSDTHNDHYHRRNYHHQQQQNKTTTTTTTTTTIKKSIPRSQTLPPFKQKPPTPTLRKNVDKPSSQKSTNNNNNENLSKNSSDKKQVTTTAIPTTTKLAYRQKRLPDSRTTRLMMGISTTGRTSTKESSTTSPTSSSSSSIEVSKTLSTSAKRLTSSITSSFMNIGNKKQEGKQRPVSFSGPRSTTSTALSTTSSSNHHHPKNNYRYQSPPPMPPLPSQYKNNNNNETKPSSTKTSPIHSVKSRRRLSAPSIKHGSPSSPPPASNGSIGKSNTLKGIKALRAY